MVFMYRYILFYSYQVLRITSYDVHDVVVVQLTLSSSFRQNSARGVNSCVGEVCALSAHIIAGARYECLQCENVGTFFLLRVTSTIRHTQQHSSTAAAELKHSSSAVQQQLLM